MASFRNAAINIVERGRKEGKEGEWIDSSTAPDIYKSSFPSPKSLILFQSFFFFTFLSRSIIQNKKKKKVIIIPINRDLFICFVFRCVVFGFWSDFGFWLDFRDGIETDLVGTQGSPEGSSYLLQRRYFFMRRFIQSLIFYRWMIVCNILGIFGNFFSHSYVIVPCRLTMI